jgi:hypothetical protein
MNQSSEHIKIPAGSYEKFEFRFTGTNEAAQNITASDLGELNIFYFGKQRSRIKFSELQTYNNRKGGCFEETRNVGAAFAFGFFIYNRHPDDDQNVYRFDNDSVAYFEWIPSAALAAAVVASSQFRVVGYEKLGLMKYWYGWNRRDIVMAVGETTPEHLTPYNIAELYIEYNTNIDNFDLRIDGKTVYTSAEIVETLNESLDREKVETYAQSGYAGIDVDRSKTLLETLNSDVVLVLRGGASDTISVFWQYFDFLPTDLQKTQAYYNAARDNIISSKVNTGGIAATRILSETGS